MGKDYGELLKRLLSKSRANVTGRKVACCIVDKKGLEYTGYNVEIRNRSIHAEEKALLAKNNRNKIKEVHLISGGDVMSIKNAMPCENCSKKLLPFSVENTKIILYLKGGKRKYSFYLRDILKKYKGFRKKIFLNGNKELNGFLKDNTPLTEIDRCVIKKIYFSFLGHKNVNFFISGSACGRGGPKSLLSYKITGSSYWDLDIILITKKIKVAENIFKLSYKSALNELDFKIRSIKEKKLNPYRFFEKGKAADSGLRKLFWARGLDLEIKKRKNYRKDFSKPSVIDLSIGKKLASTITDEYIKKNWYIRLI